MEQNKAPSLVAIIACYYPAYFEQAIKNLERLLTSIKPEFQIIVINNNDQPIKHKGLNVVKGSNQCWEFSAWDEGIEFMTNNYSDFTQSTFVFLNDTFYTHRIFTFLDFHFFKAGVKRVSHGKFDIAGEFNSFGESFTVQGIKSLGWISTYMFIIHGNKLSDVLPFSKIQDNDSITVNVVKKEILLSECSSNLTEHIKSWFFPKNTKLGWYGGQGQSNTDNTNLFNMKVKMILNEKLLLAVANVGHLKTYDIYGSFFKKMYLLSRKFIYKFILPSIKFTENK